MVMKLNLKDVKDVLLSIVFSLIFNVVFIMLLALIVMFFDVTQKAIIALNVVFKILSIILSIFIIFKEQKHGITKGFLVGAFYCIVTYFIYAIVNKEFSLNSFTIFDIIACVFSSSIGGVVKVNITKKEI